MTLEIKGAYRKGQRVKYIPQHAHGDASHPDCETGVVSSVSRDGKTIFVKYDRPGRKMLTGDEDITAQGTDVWDLIGINDATFAELWRAVGGRQ
jgi:hypothetical protein